MKTVLFLLSVSGMILQALVFRDMWRWFIVPVTRWPPLNLAYAAGIILTAWALQGRATATTSQDNEAQVAATLKALINCITCLLLSWGIGWVLWRNF